jgi:hypothetical protein
MLNLKNRHLHQGSRSPVIALPVIALPVIALPVIALPVIALHKFCMWAN